MLRGSSVRCLLASLLIGVLAFVASTQRRLLYDLLDISTVAATNSTATGPSAAQSPPASAAGEDSALLVYVGYLSAPNNRAKRDSLREECFPQIREACLGRVNVTHTNSSNVGWGPSCDVRFFIGQPNDPNEAAKRAKHHSVGKMATQSEIDAADKLQNESDAFGDVQMLPMRDTYHDLPDKTLSILRHGALSGATVVLKIDDDRCPDSEFDRVHPRARVAENSSCFIGFAVAKVLEVASSTPPNVARYVGVYLFKGTEYPHLQKGADGSRSPYMSGPAYLLSNALARAVAIDDINHSVLYMKYGSSSEDVDMGKWYEYAKTTHPELEFVREEVKGLAREHPAKKAVRKERFVATKAKTLGPMVQTINDRKCWAVVANNAIAVEECNASKPSQNFTLADDGRIQVGTLPGHCFNFRDHKMSKCLEGNGEQQKHQLFRYDGTTGLVKGNDGAGPCVDYNVEEGRIAQWECHDMDNQKFRTYVRPAS